MSKRWRWRIGLALLALLWVGLFADRPTVASSETIARLLDLPLALSTQPAVAERPRPADLWQAVYQQVPELPLENQYISRETGEVAIDNTLVGRMIRYHIYVEGRPITYRLDWKLTIADYLGVNEFILPRSYPSSDTLTVNPVEGDRAAVAKLTRSQRDALVNALVQVFSQSSGAEAAPAAPLPAAPPNTPAASPAVPRLQAPQPGDAQQLAP